MIEPPAQRPWVLWLALLIVAGFFLPVVVNGFSRIDDPLILKGEHLNPPEFTADKALWYWRNPELGLYAPLTYTVWAVVAKATYVPTADEAGLHTDPRVFHAVSLLIHLVNVGLVFVLLRRLLPRPKSEWAAAVGALLYGLHPLQVEAVAWISGMKDLLYTTAALAVIILYLQAMRAWELEISDLKSKKTPAPPPPMNARGRIAAYICGLLLVPIGMLFKPTAMVAPLIAMVLDLVILRRPLRKVLLAITPYLLAAVPLAIVARQVQPWDGVPSPPFWQRPMVSGGSIAFYAARFVAPLHLGFDYGWRPVEMLSKGWFWAVGAMTLLIVIGLIVLTRRRLPWVAAAIGVFICAVLPVLGLTPFSFQFFSTVADHYLVLAMLGPAIGLAYCLSRAKPVWWIAAGIWLVALGTRSTLQIFTWHDELRMAQHTVAVNPKSSLGHNSLGELAMNQHDFGKAEREFRLAAEVNPDFLGPPDHLARLYAMQGRVDEAINAFHLMQKTAARFPAGVGPNYRWYLRQIMARIAVQVGRPMDAQRYLEEERRIYGPVQVPGV